MLTRWPRCCAVCAAVLPENRTVDYCGKACRGVLRAWARAERLDDTDPDESARRILELRSIAWRRMEATAEAEGLSIDGLNYDRYERTRSAARPPAARTLSDRSAKASR